MHWAHLNRDSFPGGRLYADLSSGAGPAEVLDGFLQALGVLPADVPVHLHQRSTLLRSQLAGRRALVILDNAVDTQQVRPLLPGADCCVLIASRSSLRGLVARDGAHRLDLGGPSDERE